MPDAVRIAIETAEYPSFNSYVELIREKKELEERLFEIESRLKTLEPQLLASFSETGWEKVRLGGFTISPHREPWVYPKLGVTREQVCGVLKACGMPQYVRENFNTRSLTKFVRELETRNRILEQDGASALALLPPELAKVLEIKPAYRIQTRRV